MKLFWYSHSNESSGAERMMIETMVILHKADVEVEALIPNIGSVHSVWASLPFPVRKVPFAWWATRFGQATVRRHLSAFGRNFASILYLIWLFLREKPDIILTNTIVAPSAAIAAKIVGIDHLWFIHEMDEGAHAFEYFLGRPNSIRLINSLSRLIVVNSQVVWDHYAKVLPTQKLRVLNYAIEPVCRFPSRKSQGLSGNLELILLGALTPGKRQEDAIRAVGILKEKGVNVNLALVGGDVDAYAADLRNLTSLLNLNDRVTFIGETDRPLDYLANSHVSLMCSQDEAFGRVTVESMKVGLPVIGARSGSTAELIADCETGLLYDPGDYKALAACIAAFAANRSLVARMGDLARKVATSNFNNRRCYQEINKLFS